MTESKECPKCEAKLPPMFSTGRLVCTKCGWSDRPNKSIHSDTPIVQTVLDKVQMVYDKAFPDDIELVEKEEKINTSTPINLAGNLFSIIGFFTMMGGVFYDTFVSSDNSSSYGRVVNIGRVSDRATITSIGGFFFIYGAVSSLTPTSKKDD